MSTTKQIELEGWLQDLAENAEALLMALQMEVVHFSGDSEKLGSILAAIKEANYEVNDYRCHCEDAYTYNAPEPETDPGPSQEQRS